MRLVNGEGSGGGERIKVLAEEIGGDCLVVRSYKLIKLDGKEI